MRHLTSTPRRPSRRSAREVTMVTTDVELVRALRDLPGWHRHSNNIRKTFHFDDFAAATRFVDRVALADRSGRSPAGH
jgi:pterin-4a-carbinolamine dehydratase